MPYVQHLKTPSKVDQTLRIFNEQDLLFLSNKNLTRNFNNKNSFYKDILNKNISNNSIEDLSNNIIKYKKNVISNNIPITFFYFLLL